MLSKFGSLYHISVTHELCDAKYFAYAPSGSLCLTPYLYTTYVVWVTVPEDGSKWRVLHDGSSYFLPRSKSPPEASPTQAQITVINHTEKWLQSPRTYSTEYKDSQLNCSFSWIPKVPVVTATLHSMRQGWKEVRVDRARKEQEEKVF